MERLNLKEILEEEVYTIFSKGTTSILLIKNKIIDVPVFDEYRLYRREGDLYLEKQVIHWTGKREVGYMKVKYLYTIIKEEGSNNVKIDNVIYVNNNVEGLTETGFKFRIGNIIAINKIDFTSDKLKKETDNYLEGISI